jgi:hypothetical protein
VSWCNADTASQSDTRRIRLSTSLPSYRSPFNGAPRRACETESTSVRTAAIMALRLRSVLFLGGPGMPEKATIERARRDKRAGKAPTTQAGEFVREEIHHIREGKHGARSTKQAIAIGLSKARRAGVKLSAPPASAKPGTKRSAKHAPRAGSHGRKPPARRRSHAISGALKGEGRAAASRQALARQARSSARRRSAAARRAAAQRAVRTKGSRGRRAAARKAARTRQRRRRATA